MFLVVALSVPVYSLAETRVVIMEYGSTPYVGMV